MQQPRRPLLEPPARAAALIPHAAVEVTVTAVVDAWKLRNVPDGVGP